MLQPIKPLIACFMAALLITSAGAASAAQPDTAVININTATVEQLTYLPRIGEKRAKQIVAFRTKRPFKRSVELARVRGIGLKTVRKLKPWLRVKGPTTLASKLVIPKKTARRAAAAPLR